MYCVYEHWRPDTDLCFYVGAGKGPRAMNMKARTARHLRVQASLADLGMCVEVRMVGSGLTRDQAHALEAERIALWRGMGVDLVNMAGGGPGTSGLKHSAESRARRSAAMMGNSRGKGVPKSEEWKQKVSASNSGAGNHWYGKKRSDEFRRFIAEVNKGRKHSEETRRKMSEKAKLREKNKREARDGACRS